MSEFARSQSADGLESLPLLGFGREIFSPEHDAFRETTRRFFKNEIEPNARQWEKDGFFPAELFRKAGKAGLLASGIPAEYGGGGGDFLHLVIFNEEHGYSPAGASLEGGMATDTSTYVVLYAGTEEQKKEWLPGFAAGETIAELALSEAHSGSDAAAIQTTARRDGNDFIINGTKIWITNGPILTDVIVAARAEAGLRLFLVSTKAKGVTVSKPSELMLKGSGGVAEIFFDDVRIPARNQLGGDNPRSFGDALATVTVGRLATSARMLAASELAYHPTVDFVKNRKAFGQTIFDFQNTQFKLASIKTEIAVGRGYLDQLLRKNLEGRLDRVESAMAKLWLSETEARIMDECLQLFGGAGYSNEYPISKMYTYARVHRLLLGTSEIQRVTIARSI